MRRVLLVSPEDSIVKALEHEVKDRKEGFIHVLRHSGNDRQEYSVIFAPVARPGGFVPAKHFSRIEEVRAFLLDRLRVPPSSVEDAMVELAQKGTTSIFPVLVTTRQVKKLGLA